MANINEFTKFVNDYRKYTSDTATLERIRKAFDEVSGLDAISVLASSDPSKYNSFSAVTDWGISGDMPLSHGVVGGGCLLVRNQCLEQESRQRDEAILVLNRLAEERRIYETQSPVAIPMDPPEEPESADKEYYLALKADDTRKSPTMRAISGLFSGLILAVVLSLVFSIIGAIIGTGYPTWFSNIVWVGCMGGLAALGFIGQKKRDEATKEVVYKEHKKRVKRYEELNERYQSLVRYAERERVERCANNEDRKQLVIGQCDAYVEALEGCAKDNERIFRNSMVLAQNSLPTSRWKVDDAFFSVDAQQTPFDSLVNIYNRVYTSVINQVLSVISQKIDQERDRLYYEHQRLANSGILGESYWDRMGEILRVMRDGLAGDSAEALRFLLTKDREDERDRATRASRERMEAHSRAQAEAAMRQAEASERAAQEAARAREIQERHNQELKQNLDEVTARFKEVSSQNAELSTSLEDLRGQNENLTRGMKNLEDEIFYRNHGYYPN